MNLRGACIYCRILWGITRQNTLFGNAWGIVHYPCSHDGWNITTTTRTHALQVDCTRQECAKLSLAKSLICQLLWQPLTTPSEPQLPQRKHSNFDDYQVQPPRCQSGFLKRSSTNIDGCRLLNTSTDAKRHQHIRNNTHAIPTGTNSLPSFSKGGHTQRKLWLWDRPRKNIFIDPPLGVCNLADVKQTRLENRARG